MTSGGTLNIYSGKNYCILDKANCYVLDYLFALILVVWSGHPFGLATN